MDKQPFLRDALFDLTMRQKWDEVVRKFEDRSAHAIRLTELEDTAFHIAISSYNSKILNLSHERCVKEMIRLMKEEGSLCDVVRMPNVRGDTPLHIAAAVGWEAICILISSQDPKLITIRNGNGETPLFVAAHRDNLRTFLSLHRIYNPDKDRPVDESLCRRKDGNTFLHSAISGEFFTLAYLIMKDYKNLLHYVNIDGETPLHVLARKPNLFKSCSRLGFYESIIYRCVFVDDDDLNKQPEHASSEHNDRKFPENYRTCVDIFSLLLNPLHKIYRASLSRREKQNDVENPLHDESFLAGRSRSKKQNAAPTDRDGDGENPTNVAEDSFPPNYTTCISISISIFKLPTNIFLILGIDFLKMSKIRERKVRHSHAMKIMKEMIEFELRHKYNRPNTQGRPPLYQHLQPFSIPGGPPIDEEEEYDFYRITGFEVEQKHRYNRKDQNQSADKKSEGVVKDTPLIEAAKMGILEIVKEILSSSPGAIHDQDSQGKNVVMVAAENRQISVFNFLMQTNLPDYVFHHLDNDGNSILHLAAKLGDKQPWHIPGAALQMQWEILWYKHVKRSIPSLSHTHHNAKGESPKKIFTQTHEHLVKSGNEWMIKTSESCSVVAALIATVAFATSATVPGGLDQQHGYPLLKDQQAFDIFSIASPIALCLSITALFYFLTIVSWRFEEHEFEQDLPRKLLMGLTCLFSGIAAMLLSFIAGHTFVLTEKKRTSTVLIYGAAMIPVMFFAMGQLPMYIDLVRAARVKVPLCSYKVFHEQ